MPSNILSEITGKIASLQILNEDFAKTKSFSDFNTKNVFGLLTNLLGTLKGKDFLLFFLDEFIAELNLKLAELLKKELTKFFICNNNILSQNLNVFDNNKKIPFKHIDFFLLLTSQKFKKYEKLFSEDAATKTLKQAIENPGTEYTLEQFVIKRDKEWIYWKTDSDIDLNELISKLYIDTTPINIKLLFYAVFEKISKKRELFQDSTFDTFFDNLNTVELEEIPYTWFDFDTLVTVNQENQNKVFAFKDCVYFELPDNISESILNLTSSITPSFDTFTETYIENSETEEQKINLKKTIGESHTLNLPSNIIKTLLTPAFIFYLEIIKQIVESGYSSNYTSIKDFLSKNYNLLSGIFMNAVREAFVQFLIKKLMVELESLSIQNLRDTRKEQGRYRLLQLQSLVNPF